jgi:hypothetical protein
MHKPTTCKGDPPKRQPMVSGSDYYRKRADIDRGLKKRDFPAADDSTPSEKADEQKVDAEKAAPKP